MPSKYPSKWLASDPLEQLPKDLLWKLPGELMGELLGNLLGELLGKTVGWLWILGLPRIWHMNCLLALSVFACHDMAVQTVSWFSDLLACH